MELNTNLVKTVHPTSCVDVPKITSIFEIQIPSIGLRNVPCDADFHGGGWLVFQRRINGKVSFERNWVEYKEGFGDLQGDYWLGLEKLHQITKAHPQELLIQIENWENFTGYALYEGFAIGNEDDKYRLNKSKPKSFLLENSFKHHFGYKFTTDEYCTTEFTGGWWWNNCYGTNLNSLYPNEEQRKRSCQNCMNWNGFFTHVPLKFVQMMIRPMKT